MDLTYGLNLNAIGARFPPKSDCPVGYDLSYAPLRYSEQRRDHVRIKSPIIQALSVFEHVLLLKGAIYM